MKNLIQKFYATLLIFTILSTTSVVAMDPVETTRQTMFDSKNNADQAQKDLITARVKAGTMQDQVTMATKARVAAENTAQQARDNTAANINADKSQGISLNTKDYNKRLEDARKHNKSLNDSVEQAKKIEDAAKKTASDAKNEADQAQTHAQKTKSEAQKATDKHQKALSDAKSPSLLNKVTEFFKSLVGRDKISVTSDQLSKTDLKSANFTQQNPDLISKIRNLDVAQKQKIFNDALAKETMSSDQALKNTGNDQDRASLYQHLESREDAIKKNIESSGMLKPGEMLVLRKNDELLPNGDRMVRPLSHQFIVVDMAEFNPFAKNIDSSATQLMRIKTQASVSTQARAMNLATNFYLFEAKGDFIMPKPATLTNVQEAIKQSVGKKAATMEGLKEFTRNPGTDPINPEFLRFMTNRVFADQLTRNLSIEPSALHNIKTVEDLRNLLTTELPSFTSKRRSLQSMIMRKYIEQTSIPEQPQKSTFYKNLIEESDASFRPTKDTTTTSQDTAHRETPNNAAPGLENTNNSTIPADKPSPLDKPDYGKNSQNERDNAYYHTSTDTGSFVHLGSSSELGSDDANQDPFEAAWNASPSHPTIDTSGSTTSTTNNSPTSDDSSANFNDFMKKFH